MSCVICQQPLVVEVEPEEDVGASSGKGRAPEPETVPDDVELKCGCHYHWQCLLEAYEQTQCPHCGQDIATNSPTVGPQVFCTLTNEGGRQEALDILPLLTEEAYLKAYPEHRRTRAFLEFCREGDIAAIVEMLQDDEEEEEEDEDEDEPRKATPDELLYYQDPLGNMESALHAAVQGGSREVVWLLLLLASHLPLTEFPAQVFQEAEALGIMRGDMMGKPDIRALRDGEGKSAEDLAREMGGVWAGWAGTGRLAI